MLKTRRRAMDQPRNDAGQPIGSVMDGNYEHMLQT